MCIKDYSPETYHILCKHQSKHPEFSSSQIQQSLDDSKKVFNATYTFWKELKDKLSGQDKTFFKEGIFWYFEPFAWVTQMKNVLIPDIDLRPLMEFEHQKGKDDCNKTCKSIISKLGIESEGATQKNAHSYYQVAIENSEHTRLIFDDEKMKEGLNYIDASLEKGYPVMVGVNHTFKKEIGNEKDIDTTDHYVVIVGRFYQGNNYYYRFWDVGTSDGEKNDYKFKLTQDGKLVCSHTYRKDGKGYTVTQIRRNIKNKKTLNLKDLL